MDGESSNTWGVLRVAVPAIVLINNDATETMMFEGEFFVCGGMKNQRKSRVWIGASVCSACHRRADACICFYMLPNVF